MRQVRWMLLVSLLCVVSCGGETTTPRRMDEASSSPVADPSPVLPEGCMVDDEVPRVLRFGVTPYLDIELLKEHFSHVLVYLEQETGYRFELVPGESYVALVGQLEAGTLDLASLSPLTYVKARERMPCMQLLLTQVSLGATTYSGYIVARADSRIEHLEDMRGKRFAFTNTNSASGYLFPKAFLLEQGIEPNAFFGDVQYVGSHLRALEAVLDSKVDAAATFSSFMKPARATDLDVGNLRVISVTGSIPHDAVVARPGLPPAVASAVQKALRVLNTATDDGRRVLDADIEVDGWVLTRESVYDPVRAKLELLGEEGR